MFRRITGEPPAPPAPQLLGFAEPVGEMPPVEDPPPLKEDAAPAAEADFPGIAAVESAAAPPEPEPEPEPEPAVTARRIRARVRDLPPAATAPAASVTPASAAPDRPQSLVGRLGRRLGDASDARSLQSPPAPPGDDASRSSAQRNRRAYRRARVPAEIEINGVPCTLIDVSIGGFAASGVPQIEPNALVPVTIRLVIDGIEVGTQLSARIVYVTHGRSAGRFIDLSPSQMAFLRYVVTWRGESVGAVGTTTLLDAIAGGADRAFAYRPGERPEPTHKPRWWAGLIGKKVYPSR